MTAYSLARLFWRLYLSMIVIDTDLSCLIAKVGIKNIILLLFHDISLSDDLIILIVF